MDIRRLIAEELHKPARRNFPRRSTVIKGINDLYQADLVEMRPYSRINKGLNYILTVINCFTKVAHAVPLRNKSAQDVVKAMEMVLRKIGDKMKLLQTDDGKEYYNQRFSELMSKWNVKHYSTKSEKKASIIERFNRTLKSAMYKRFSQRGSYVWHDILTDLIREYNGRVHRTIGMKPKDVNKSNERIVLKRIKQNTKPRSEQIPPKKFYVGDKVRISKYKRLFTKGYLPNWTNEVFTVAEVQPTIPETYLLKDHKEQLLQGGFYGHEMLKSNIGNIFLVEKVLKRKGDRVLVRWVGFDRSEDSWIPKKDLI